MRGIEESYLLPPDTGAATLVSYESDRIPSLRGTLLVGSGDSGTLTRIALDGSSPTRVLSMDVLLDNVGGRIRALAVNSDGAIYLCLSNEVKRLAAAGM
jgi:glucose/arabinose dehydrogenase